MKYEFYRGDPKLMNYQHLLKYDMHDAHPLKKTRFIVSPLKRNGMVRTAVPCATQPAMLTSTVLSLLVHTYMYGSRIVPVGEYFSRRGVILFGRIMWHYPV